MSVPYLILVYCVCSYVSGLPELEFLEDYFTLKNVYSLNLFCCSFEESLSVMNNFRNKRFTSSTDNPQSSSGWPPAARIEGALKAVDYKLGVFVDLECQYGIDVLKEASDNFLFNSTYVWLVWKETLEAGIRLLEPANLAINSEVSLASGGIRVYDVFKINYSTPLVARRIGRWRSGFGFVDITIDRKENLRGLQLKAIIVLNELETNESNVASRVLDRNLNVTSDAIHRFTYAIHECLRDIFNFTLKVVQTDQWGYYFKELGHYDGGMFGALEANTVDIGISPAEQLKSRMDIVDWVTPIKTLRELFVFRHPKVFSGYSALLKPFTSSVWLCLMLSAAASSVLLTVITHVRMPDSSGNEPSLTFNVIFVLGAIAQQGLSTTSTRASKRIIHAFLLFLSSMTYAFYGAAIVIFLLSPTPITINTVTKLTESNLKLGAEDLPYTRFHLVNRSNPDSREAYRKKIKGATPGEDRFYNISYGTHKLRTSAFALYGHDINIYNEIKKTFSDSEICQLTELAAYPPYKISISIRKKLPYKELINKGIMKTRESGIVTREDQFWLTPRPGCLGQEGSVSVGTGSLMVAYLIYTIGLLLSLMILALERIFKYGAVSNNINGWLKIKKKIRVIKGLA